MKKKRIIQVPMPDYLVADLDAIAEKQDRSRASVLREAAAEYITKTEEAEKVRQYVEGMEKHGEAMSDDEAEAWVRAGVESMEPEDFSDWKA